MKRSFEKSPEFKDLSRTNVMQAPYGRALDLLEVKNLPKGSVFLDIGGGYGTVGKILEDKCGNNVKYVNVDTDMQALRTSPGNRVAGDRGVLPIKSQSAHAATYFFPASPTHPNENKWDVERGVLPLVQAIRALKPGGKVCIMAHVKSENLMVLPNLLDFWLVKNNQIAEFGKDAYIYDTPSEFKEAYPAQSHRIGDKLLMLVLKRTDHITDEQLVGAVEKLHTHLAKD